MHTLHSGTAKKGVRFIESEKYTNGPKIFRANANIDNDLYEAPKIWIYEFCINSQKGWKKLHNIRIFFWKKYTTTIWKQKGSLDFEIKSRFLFEKKGFSIKKNDFRSLSWNRVVENERYYLLSALCNDLLWLETQLTLLVK